VEREQGTEGDRNTRAGLEAGRGRYLKVRAWEEKS